LTGSTSSGYNSSGVGDKDEDRLNSDFTEFVRKNPFELGLFVLDDNDGFLVLDDNEDFFSFIFSEGEGDGEGEGMAEYERFGDCDGSVFRGGVDIAD